MLWVSDVALYELISMPTLTRAETEFALGGMPSTAEVPADTISRLCIGEVFGRAAMACFRRASPIGERHILPVQRNITLFFTYMSLNIFIFDTTIFL